MKVKILYAIFMFCTLVMFSSCESEEQKQEREAIEEQQRIKIETERQERAKEVAFEKEQVRIESKKREEAERARREVELARQREEKATYDRYINNSLRTGATPYAYCFGGNRSCSDWGCAGISVKTPYNSDVLVTIKKNGSVYRHAYIKAGDTFKFELPNGTYQPFFYYGTGWDPNKFVKKADCGILKGGFIAKESFSKDSPQMLDNSMLSYELILQENGNFSTKPSTSDEAF